MDREQLRQLYESLRSQGLSHEDALARVRAQATTPSTQARPSASESRPSQRGAVSNFARGAALGASEAGSSLVGGLGWLTELAGRAIPGDDPVERAGRKTQEFAGGLEESARRSLDPRGRAGSIGRVLGRIGGEIGTAAATFGLGKAGALRYAPRAAEAVRRFAGGSRARSALAATATELPYSVVQAGASASRSGDPQAFLPSLGLELAGSAAGGLAFPMRRGEDALPSRDLTKGEDQATGAIEAMRSVPVVSINPSRKPPRDAGTGRPAPNRFVRFIDETRRQFVDNTLPLVRAMQRNVGEQEAGRLSDLLSQKNASSRMAIDEFEERLGGIAEKSDEYIDALARYSAVKREIAMRAKRPGMRKLVNQETGRPFTASELREVIQAGRSVDGLDRDAQKLNDYFRDLLDLQRQSGLISDSEYQRIVSSQGYYIPFARSFAQAAEGDGQRWFNRMGPSARVSGMDAESVPDLLIQNPLLVAAQEGQAVFDAVAKQNVFDTFARYERLGYFRDGDVIQRVAPDYKPKPNENIIYGTSEGAPVAFRVNDKGVHEALVGLSAPGNNLFSRLARGFTTLKRNTITALPGFALLSIARDIPQYALQRRDIGRAATEALAGAGAGAATGAAVSEEGDRASGAITGALIGSGVGSLARPASEVARAATAYAGTQTRLGVAATEGLLRATGIDVVGPRARLAIDNWIANGGITESFYAKSTEEAAGVIDAIRRSNKSLAESIVSPKGWWDTLVSIGRIAERAPRLAEYRRAMEAGATPAQAVRMSHDVTLDFAKKGVTGAKVAPYVAFFNAKLQGWDKLARLMGDEKTWGLGAAMLLAPTVGLWRINKDNPDYWDRPEWEKNIFWLIPDPDGEGGFVRVPKPFELGTAFASSFERLLDNMVRSGAIESRVAPKSPDTSIPDVLGGVVRSIGSYAGESLIFTPDVATPVLQQIANRDLFRGRDIVPLAQRQLPSELQYTERTGALPRAIGSAVGASPLRVEQLIGDVFGTVGRRAQDVLIDPLARAAGLPAPMPQDADRGPAGILGEAVGLGRFRTKEYAVGQVEYDARDMLERIDSSYRQLQRMAAEGASQEDVREFARENIGDLSARERLRPARLMLDRINRARRAVSRNTSIDPKDRQELLRKLSERANEISRAVLGSGVGQQ